MKEPGNDPTDSLARELRADPARAASRVDEEFRSRLVRLAERLLDPRVRGAVDGEDVAQSVFRSFFCRQEADPLPIGSRIELWHLLATIARRKCVKVARRALAQKRGGDRQIACDDTSSGGWDVADATAVPPEAVAVMNDLYRELVGRLDELHRPVCELRLDGLEVAEIATRLGLSHRTVERRLARIRDRLEALDPAE